LFPFLHDEILQVQIFCRLIVATSAEKHIFFHKIDFCLGQIANHKLQMIPQIVNFNGRSISHHHNGFKSISSIMCGYFRNKAFIETEKGKERRKQFAAGCRKYKN
jgi:hypothetical protein